MSAAGEIILKVYIENKVFEIDCDTGIQDVAWVALSACYLYGKETYPATTYIPIMAKNISGEILHPKMVILQNKKVIGDEITVKVRKKYGALGSELSDEEKEWYNNAFLEGRFMVNVDVFLKPASEIRKDNKFKVEFKFRIEDNIRELFPNFPDILVFEMRETDKKSEYTSRMKIPRGKLTINRIIFTEKKSDEWDKETTDLIKNDVTIKKYPEELTHLQKEEYLRNKESMIRDKEIKIKQEIMNAEKKKKEEEIRLKELAQYMEKIPFSLEEIYSYTQNELALDEQDILEIFELLERNEYLIYRKLFEIFSDYCKFYKNEEDDKYAIDALAELNFLSTFFDKRENLKDLPEEFQREYISRFEKDINEIDFKEFVFIIIFLLNSVLKHKDIKITEEIEAILQSYEEKMKMKSYRALYKNEKINQILNDNHLVIRTLFEKFGKKKDKTEIIEMTPIQLLNFTNDISKKFKLNIGDMAKEETTCENKDIDFFDFMRTIVAIALNLVDNESGKGSDSPYDFTGVSEEQAVYLFVDAIKKYLEL